MKSSVKIIKRNRSEHSENLPTSVGEKSLERSTREMVTTVKGWIAELQQRKREQGHGLPSLPALPQVGTLREVEQP